MSDEKRAGEHTGLKTNYYVVDVTHPNRMPAPYRAECGDIIEALQMDFNMGNEFKAIWRAAAAKALGLLKQGNTELYDAQKRVFYSGRSLALLAPFVPPQPTLPDNPVPQQTVNLSGAALGQLSYANPEHAPPWLFQSEVLLTVKQRVLNMQRLINDPMRSPSELDKLLLAELEQLAKKICAWEEGRT